MVETHIAPDTVNSAYFYILECNTRGPLNTQVRNSYASGRGNWWEDWDTTEGFRRAYAIHGTANTLTDVDTSWTFEFRIPYDMLTGWKATAHTAPASWNPQVPPVPVQLQVPPGGRSCVSSLPRPPAEAASSVDESPAPSTAPPSTMLRWRTRSHRQLHAG